MYQVTIHHHDKAWRNGDLEDDMFLVAQETFKTRKAAKEFMERDVSRRGCSTIHRDYHKGEEPSYIWAYTGVKWVHENSGEDMEEYYRYIMKKAKLR